MNNKKRIILIGTICLLIISCVFFLPITENLIVGYVFGVIGIISGVFSVLFLTKKNVKIPQDIAFPIETRIYLIVNLFVSFIVIELEFLGVIRLAFWVLLIFQLLLMAVFTIRIFILSSGKEHIDKIEQKVDAKISSIQLMLADLSVIKNLSKELPTEYQTKAEQEISNVFDELKYSDPMIHQSLEVLESDIKTNILKLKEEVMKKNQELIFLIIKQIINQIQDRNNRAKILK